jgi:hypothetical protein
LGKGSLWSQPSCLHVHDGAIPEVVAWFNKTSNLKDSNSGCLGILRALNDTQGGVGIQIFQWEGRREILPMDQELNTELIIRTSAEQPGNPTVLKIRIENSGVSRQT